MLFELIAQGADVSQRVRFRLDTEQEYILGRDSSADLPVAWDPYVSRRHLSLKVEEERLEVTMLDKSSNPLFFGGKEVEHCYVRDSDHFVIGSTTFYIVASELEFGSSSVEPVQEVTFSRKELQAIRIHDADRRLDVLADLSKVISEARTELELYHQLVNLLFTGVNHAEAVAIMSIDSDDDAQIMHWDRRHEVTGEFRPSSRLVIDALLNRNRSVLHVWGSQASQMTEYTEFSEFDWAFCTPIHDGSKTLWGIYVAGKIKAPFTPGEQSNVGESDLHADVKFTEIVAELISSVQRSNRWERQRAAMRQFFAPPILESLGDDMNSSVLDPRKCDVTVLFCDLRGFSREAEASADDLLGLLDRVSGALGIMQRQILQHGGVTGDFLGDAALGFWGWPIESDDSALNACRAALGIQAAFAEIRDQKDHPLANFQMGIGIAHGPAVAGKIGTQERVTVTVFGPVVNLASRLETMTKQLRVPIVLDDPTTSIVRGLLDSEEGRIRKLGRVLPYGMEKPVTVSELLPPESAYPELTDEHCRIYEEGVERFIAGDWQTAYQLFHKMPAEDRAQDFLGKMIIDENRIAPAGWDGVIKLPSK